MRRINDEYPLEGRTKNADKTEELTYCVAEWIKKIEPQLMTRSEMCPEKVKRYRYSSFCGEKDYIWFTGIFKAVKKSAILIKHKKL